MSRRRFVAGLGSSMLLPAVSRATGAATDESLIAILNDTHIGQKQAATSQNPSHLREAVKWLLALDKRPAAVLINGDLALLDGQPGDYAAFLELIRPLREAGLSIHLTLGNHDDREVFFETIRRADPATPLDEAKYLGTVETKFANLFLLDSLKTVNKAPGELGAAQLEWLTKQLDSRSANPAIIIAHHNPRLGGDPLHFPGGLEDSDALWQMLALRKHVKAYIHGHIHHWSLASHQGIHIINTPAVSYVANPKTSTTGWTMARLSDRSIELTLHTHVATHEWNGVVTKLDWRA